MNKLLIAGITAVALALTAPVAQAQLNLGAATGPVFPVGGLSDVVGSGFHAGLVGELEIPVVPFGLRGDLMYQNLSAVDGADAFTQISGTVNARFRVELLPLLFTYVTGGAGLYGSSFEYDETGPRTGSTSVDLGLNGGVGARLNLGLLRPFIEIRLHSVLADESRNFIPITIGTFF